MAQDSNLGLIALTRFGYGPRGDGDVAVAAKDPRGFLTAELAEPGIALLSGPSLVASQDAIQRLLAYRKARKMEREAPSETVARPAPPPMTEGASEPAQVPKPASPAQIVFRDEALARLRRAVEARAGVAERLVAFWSNHFCVSAQKDGFIRATAGAFEREAIRPHVLGTFADMLLAVESHPAMLHYLDNARSAGPNSPAAQRRKAGLNENLGREILELHTLGVDGGYTQADVTNLARILTGWSFAGPAAVLGETGTFVFNPNAHEPGAIALLGKSYADEGLEQGRRALRDLARRPETARHIAGKLARAFVADDPPAPLIARLERVFRDTDGDLRALSLALIEAPEAWTPGPARMRTPYEFIVGTHRLLGRVPDEPGPMLGPLKAMGMPLWGPAGPNGFAPDAAAWATPEGMKMRLDYSALVGTRLKDPPNPNDLLAALCGGAPSPETRLAVSRAESRPQGLALLLMSPEMQRS